MSADHRLPAEFADLERFVEHWDVATSQERWIRRSETAQAAIRAFYDAMLARADAALTYVERFPAARPAARRGLLAAPAAGDDAGGNGGRAARIAARPALTLPAFHHDRNGRESLRLSRRRNCVRPPMCYRPA